MRSTNDSQPSYRVGPYLVDGHAREVTKSETRVDLTRDQFDVFYQIVERKGGLILRGEFKPWEREEDPPDRRHPLGMMLVNIRRKFDEEIIVTDRHRGYRLSPKFVVEVIASPSRSELEKLLAIALDQLNTHTSVGLRAEIQNCEALLEKNQVADAYVYAALAYLNLGHVGLCRDVPTVTIPKAKEILRKALHWFPTLGSAYALRGLASLTYDFKWNEAKKDFEEALRLSPDNELAHCFLAHLQVAQKSFDEGLRHAHIAAEIDYRAPMTVITEPWFMLFAGRVGEAIIKGEEVVKRFEDFGPAHDILGQIYLAAGSPKKAMEQFQLALARDFLPNALATQGYVHALEGRKKDALRCLDGIREAQRSGKIAYASSFYDAIVYAGLGEKGKALDALEKAYEEKCDWLIYLAVEPRWNSIQNEKRFQRLVERVGLVPSKSKRT